MKIFVQAALLFLAINQANAWGKWYIPKQPDPMELVAENLEPFLEAMNDSSPICQETKMSFCFAGNASTSLVRV